MDPYINLLLGLSVVILLTAWLPMLLRHRPLSLPIFCVFLGIGLFSLPGTGPDPDPIEYGVITERLAELVVIISLMGAGLRIDRPMSFRGWGITWRLLAVTMPLSILGVGLLGWGLVGLSPPAAVLLGAALAPTDPVLAADVQVGPPRSGIGGEARFSLTSEAGLNDGLAFPFVYLALAMAAEGPLPGPWTLDWLALDVVWRIGAGAAVGWSVGRVLTYLAFRLPRHTRLADTRDGFVALGMTFLSYGLAEGAHGFGFIAVFITALQLRRGERLHDYHERLHDFAEQVERLLMMVLLVLFGGAIAGGILTALTWQAALAGLLILFAIRPAAGMIGLTGSDRQLDERVVIASLGIRGIGSFYYLAFAANRAEIIHGEVIWATVAFVVLVSVVVFGAAATPVMTWLDHRQIPRHCRQGAGRQGAGRQGAG
ncbi:MAG TPA: cation:proton antiporter [Arenibaculum sp.]|nr:cation:proton antiporter [Arenibaculum sp.]